MNIFASGIFRLSGQDPRAYDGEPGEGTQGAGQLKTSFLNPFQPVYIW
jgi:hypothetical protein